MWNGAWNRLMSLSLFTKTVAERTALSISQLQQPNQARASRSRVVVNHYREPSVPLPH